MSGEVLHEVIGVKSTVRRPCLIDTWRRKKKTEMQHWAKRAGKKVPVRLRLKIVSLRKLP